MKQSVVRSRCYPACWRSLLAFAFLFCCLSANRAQQSYPLVVQTNLVPPYPIRFEDYLDLGDKILVTVMNTSSTSRTFNFAISIQGPNNLSIQRSPLFKQPFTLGPNQTKALTGNDWDFSNLLLSTNDIQPPSERQYLIQNRVLREGSYTVCLQAIDAQTGQALSSATGSNCSTYTANYGAPPVIIAPAKDQVLPFIQPVFVGVSWTQYNLINPGQIRYRVKIIDLTANNLSAPQATVAMNNPGITPVYEKDGIQSFSHAVTGVPFQEGRLYAVRVTSYDPQQQTLFQNGGHSDVVIFQFSQNINACATPSTFALMPHYPAPDDTLPFTQVPFIVRFSPECELYDKFAYRLELDNKLQRKHTVSWPQGALKFVRSKYNKPALDWAFASHQSLGNATNKLERGKAYRWDASASAWTAPGNKYVSQVKNARFVTGMPMPRLVAPGVTKKISVGKTAFRWGVRAGKEPLLPAWQLKAFDSQGTATDVSLAPLKERWVLQVFRGHTTDTARIVFQKDSLITLDPDKYLNKQTLAYDTAKFRKDFEKVLATVVDLPTAGTYYWRVAWARNPDQQGQGHKFTNGELYHSSKLREVVVEQTGLDDACVAACDAPPITDRTATGGLKAKDKLKIGLFELVVTSVKAEPNNAFSGEGYIPVTFLKSWPIKVKFEKIKKNKAGQIFEGKVTVVKDKDFLPQGQVVQAGSAIGLSPDLAKALGNFLNQGGRLVNSGVRKNQPIGLPIGIDNKIEGNTIVVAILDMKFTPQRATLTAVVNLDIPALSPYRANLLSLGIKDFCFGPKGTGSRGTALLPRDIVIDVDDPKQVPKEDERTQIVIKGSLNASDPQQRTEVVWDCKGFRHVNLAIEVRFSRKAIVPDGPQGKPGSGRVTATAFLKGARGLNFIGKLQMKDFQIPVEAMKGYAFKVEEAWIDLSSIDNPAGLVGNLPKNYQSADLNSTDKKVQALWRGFWLKEMSVKIPHYIGNVNSEQDRHTQVSARNIIIDKTGFTAAFLVEGLIKWESPRNKPKHIDGVRFSLDSLWVNVLQNSLTNAGLSGKLGIPFAERHDYLKYRGVLDHKTKATNFRFSVRVTDSLRIPMFFAQAKLDKNSTIEFQVGTHSYVAFDLSATIGIRQDSFKLDIPGIRLEHIKYHSTTGFDNKNFRFGLASPQKWFANFPLSFDNFKMTAGNAPVVSWEMTLALQGSLPKKKGGKSGGKWGLSGTVGMAIHTRLGKGKGLWDQIKGIEVKEVRLKKIALDAEVASVKIKGEVEFYKENNLDGFRGELSVTLPANIKAALEGEFGTYKKPGAKKFDTADWYSYWRIAGTVIFGEAGVPVFAGLNLYGIGGGVYHHMKRTAALPALVPTKGTKKEKEKPTAYKPDYGTSFGLLFSVLMGSPSGGKAYNFEARLEASFTRAGGMNYFGITGDAKVMCSGLTDPSPKVGGWVKIEYHKAAEEFVQGRLYITVNAGVIQGNAQIPDPPKEYTGDKSHAFIWAEFYADVSGKKDFWYFNMGTPQNRGSLAVSFDPNKKAEVKDKKKQNNNSNSGLLKIEIKFTAYLMIGHKVPATLPPPDAAFMKIWAMAGGGKNDFSGGKVSEFVKGKKRPQLPPGQGFAFGASFSLDLSANPIPFYFDMGLVFGFDINVTRNEQRRCYIPSRGEIAPGVDYWYAQGQMYAGAYADFGLKVQLWFINAKFSIFQGAAALVLRGGFPNPNWAEGRGRLGFSILGGLFKGSCAFDVAVGEKCDPTAPLHQLLDQMDFVQDLKPEDKSNEVDVFTACTATFAVPINKVMEIPANDSTIRRIVPVVSAWTLKDDNGHLVPVEDLYFTNDNLAATLNPKVVLAGNKRFTTYIEVKARELYGAGQWKYVKKNGKDWYQSKTSTFTTGKAPDVIPDRNVLFTWPLANQRYFLKEETEEGKWGYIVLDKGMTYLFKDRAKYDYLVRFTRLDGSGHTLDVTLFPTEHDRVLKFNVALLEKGKFYSLQVIEVDKALKQKLQQQAQQQAQQQQQQLTATAFNFNGAGSATLSLSQTLQLREQTVNLLQGEGSVLTSDIIKKRELPASTVRHPAERVLYHYYFGTSKYGTFKDKIAGRTWSHRQANFAFIIPGFLSEVTLDEPFEQYDRQGYTHNGYKVPPLLSIYLNGYNQQKKAGVPTNIYVKKRLEDGFLWMTDQIDYWLRHLKTPLRLMMDPPDMDQYLTFNNLSTWAGPLSRAELDAANNPPPPASSNNQAPPIIGQQPPLGASGGFISGFTFGGGTTVMSAPPPPASKLAIGYHPVLGGQQYLSQAKSRMSSLLGKYMDFPCINQAASGHFHWPSSPHWWYRYFPAPTSMHMSPSGGTWNLPQEYFDAWNKYLRDSKKCLSGPSLKQFLDKYPPLKVRTGQLLQLPESTIYMSTTPPRPHSFMMQYRYPTPRSRTHWQTGKKVSSRMAEGTWRRIEIKP